MYRHLHYIVDCFAFVFLTVIRHEIDPRQRKEKNESVYLAGRATDCFHKHIYMYKIVHRVEKKRRGGGERREKRV